MLRSFVAGLGLVALLGGCSNAGITTTSPATSPSVFATTTSIIDLSPSTSEVATSTTTVLTTTTPVVTTTTIAATATAPTTTTEPIAGLVLRGDGLGVVSFGDPMDQAMVVLTEHLGAPSYDDIVDAATVSSVSGGDSGFNACQSVTGYPCFDYARFVGWDTVGLLVVFADLTTNEAANPGDSDNLAQVPPNLRGYSYGGVDTGTSFHTPQGITAGSSVAQLLALGDQVRFWADDCPEAVAFAITEEPPADDGTIRGRMDGTDWDAFRDSGHLNPGATVRSLEAGARGSC